MYGGGCIVAIISVVKKRRAGSVSGVVGAGRVERSSQRFSSGGNKSCVDEQEVRMCGGERPEEGGVGHWCSNGGGWEESEMRSCR